MVASLADAAPIRVGIFKSIGTGRFWHTNIHTAGSAIVSILTNPDSANLGPDLIKPTDGFIATQFGKVTGTSTTTDAEEDVFFAALDSLDVVIFPTIVEMGNVISRPEQRIRLLEYFRTRGVVSIHATTDSYGAWPAWDSIHGARFLNFPPSDRQATLHLDSDSNKEPSWRALNRGLPDTARFLEEWFSFTTNADVIRSSPGLKTTVRIDEASYQGGIGQARTMGADHPMSWYKESGDGGRFFYTALGHRAQTYAGVTNNPTTPEAAYFFRRQLYNAILWAAGVDSTGTVVSVADRNRTAPARFADHAQVTFNTGALTVSILNDSPNTVEVLGVNGGRVALKRAEGRAEHRFDALRSGVYVVSVTSGGQRLTRMAVVE